MPMLRPGQWRTLSEKGLALTIDTLAYTKALEASGLDRKAAEAQAEALASHVLPQLVTKTDLDIAVERLEHRLTLRLIGIIGAFDAALFALLRFVH
jgi:hypothetical protein